MSFKNINGNRGLIQRLTNTIKNNQVSHAYIFEGEACIDKKAFANAFVKAILCLQAPGEGCDYCPICRKIDHGNHEDIIYVEADGRSVKDQAIEKMQARLKVKPYGDRNIAIISHGDTMTLRAQNRLLKTLEEPATGTIIIILSENVENLTSTIISRCVRYRINYFHSETYDEMMFTAESVADLLLEGQPFYKIKDAVEDIIKDNQRTSEFLDALQKVYRDFLIKNQEKGKLYTKGHIFDNISAIEEARRQIQQGVAKSYAVKNLMIKIGG
ncbi:MAG: hypothetical protein RSD88_07200 [Anaerovoracaceae bacterium]